MVSVRCKEERKARDHSLSRSPGVVKRSSDLAHVARLWLSATLLEQTTTGKHGQVDPNVLAGGALCKSST